MQFTHILFLMASVAIAGPLMAHLLNRSKYRRVPFTMLQFLQVSQKQTQSKRRLRDFLILLLRCAIILLIAVLFAGPVIYQQVQKETTKHHHFLVLDDSLSMSWEDGGQSGLDQMAEELSSYLDSNKGAQSVFHLYSITRGCLGQDLTAEAAAFSIDDIEISYGQVDLMGLWADLKEIQKNKGRGDTVNVHVISDFGDDVVKAFRNQPGGVDTGGFSFSMIGQDRKANNLAITNAGVVNLENERLTLSATVVNYGDKTSKRLIRAEADGLTSNEIFVNPAPKTSEHVVLTMDVSSISNKKGFLPIEIKLTPEDDLTADDVYPIAVAMEVDSRQRVLLAGYDSEELFLMHTALKTLEQSDNSCIESIDTVPYSQFRPERLASYDIVISSTVARSFQEHIEQIQEYIENGGRWVFFSDNRVHEGVAKRLYENDVLPVMVQRNMDAVRHIGKLGQIGSGVESSQTRMLSVLEQYRFETIGLWAYYQCVQCPEAVCLWQIDSMASLVYHRPVKGGSCTFINTSIDDSRSALTKNAAVLPLIQYLLGHDESVAGYHFACDEMVRIPLMGQNASKEVDYLDGEDEKHTIQAAGAFIQVPGPHRCGWIRTLTEPVCYAGIHAIDGETNLNRSYSGQIETILAGVFQRQPDDMVVQAGSSLSREARGLDKILVWVIILLILTDCFVANRMQRS